MARCISGALGLFVCLALSAIVSPAQTINRAGFKSYSSYEDYCRDNPHAPTCVNGKPLKMDDMTQWSLAGEYCRQNSSTAMCQEYCRQNPKALSCLDTRSYTSQGIHRQSKATTITGLRAASPTLQPMGKTLALTADWRFAHPHADLLVGINAAALRHSLTLRSLMEQLATRLQIPPADLQNAVAQTNDVDQCWVSVRPGDLLILLQGRVNYPSGITRLNTGAIVYRISKTAVVIGREASVRASIQRLQHPPMTSDARMMKELGTESDVWLLGTRAMFSQAHIAAAPAELSSYVIGFRFHEGLQADLKLSYASAAAARRALTTMQNISATAQSAVKTSSQIEGAVLRMKFSIDQAQLSNAVDKALAIPAMKPILALIAKSARPSTQFVIRGEEGGKRVIQTVKKAPPPPGKFVVYGMPGGPKVM